MNGSGKSLDIHIDSGMVHVFDTQSANVFSSVLLKHRHIPSAHSCPLVICSMHNIYCRLVRRINIAARTGSLPTYSALWHLFHQSLQRATHHRVNLDPVRRMMLKCWSRRYLSAPACRSANKTPNNGTQSRSPSEEVHLNHRIYFFAVIRQ